MSLCLIRRRYTKAEINFTEIFPSNIDDKDATDYLLARTFYRPRDIIVFINECLVMSDGKTSISATTIKQAEGRYSAERLHSLATEWSAIWPNLLQTSQLFYGLKESFRVSEITQQVMIDRYNEIAASIVSTKPDPITQSLNSLCTDNANFGSIRNVVLREFYITGLIGIKIGPTDAVSWARRTGHARLTAGEARPASISQLHPTFHRALR